MSSTSALTAAMREQYDDHRRAMQQQLADRVLAIVGVHKATGGQRYITTADLWAHDAELFRLLGRVRAYYPAAVRTRLYAQRVHVGVSIAKLILTVAGHPLERSRDPSGGNRFALLPTPCAA